MGLLRNTYPTRRWLVLSGHVPGPPRTPCVSQPPPAAPACSLGSNGDILGGS
jgi:hypothetical protein